jgi:hypothetical protein
VPFHTLVGFIGVFGYLSGYFLLQVGSLNADRPGFTVINLVSAICVAYSLVFDWNLPSMMIQIAWIVISLVGLARMRARRPPQASAAGQK